MNACKTMLLCVLAIANCMACATHSTWKKALSDEIDIGMGHSLVEGIYEESDSPDSPPKQYLVVAYGLVGGYMLADNFFFGSKEYHVALPLRDDAPGIRKGNERNANRIEASLSEETKTKIRLPFSKESYKRGSSSIKSNHFTPVNTGENGVYALNYALHYRSGLTIIPYWRKEDNIDVSRVNNIWDEHENINNKCKIMILPTYQPRPDMNMVKRIAVAVVVTPFALVADIIITPYKFTQWYIGMSSM